MDDQHRALLGFPSTTRNFSDIYLGCSINSRPVKVHHANWKSQKRKKTKFDVKIDRILISSALAYFGRSHPCSGLCCCLILASSAAPVSHVVVHSNPPFVPFSSRPLLFADLLCVSLTVNYACHIVTNVQVSESDRGVEYCDPSHTVSQSATTCSGCR